jgi:hypothetical protein
MNPEELVDQFIASAPRKPSRCQTCSLANAEDIDRALTRFSEAKREGRTTQDWKDFHQFVLVPSFNYPLSRQSMRDHAKKCLELP